MVFNMQISRCIGKRITSIVVTHEITFNGFSQISDINIKGVDLTLKVHNSSRFLAQFFIKLVG